MMLVPKSVWFPVELPRAPKSRIPGRFDARTAIRTTISLSLSNNKKKAVKSRMIRFQFVKRYETPGNSWMTVSRRLQWWHKKSKTTIMTPRVCPSVVSVLQANTVSNQVMGVFEQDDSADYNFQKAIQSMASRRHWAFLLLTWSQCHREKRVELQQHLTGIQLQYSVQHYQDVRLLELCCRLAGYWVANQFESRCPSCHGGATTT